MKRVKKRRSKGCPPPPGGRPPRGSYSLSLRRKAVRLYLEEGIPAPLITQELGICRETLLTWVKRFQEEGEAGLKNRERRDTGKRRHRISPAVKERIVEVKKNHPRFGVLRIAQIFRMISDVVG